MRNLEETLPESGFANKVLGAGYRVPLISCCSLKIIPIIKENLHEENLKAFEHSCFGHLLQMNPLRFQGSLLSHLLLHMDRAASSNNTTLSFNINNSSMEFRPRDFQLITGLLFGTSEAAAATTETSSRIHEDVFGASLTITFKDVEEAFLVACRDHEGKGELSLKLAFIYFVYGVVLPVGDRKEIDMRYLHLADDLCVFRSFPWGRVGYKFLVSSMLTARLFMDRSSTTRLEVPGFTFALQVWAYEKMPALATYCGATCTHNFENLTMRILRWSAKKVIRFKGLKQFFTLGGDDEALSAEASPEPSTSTDNIPQEERRRAQNEDVVELLPRGSEHSIPDSSYDELASPELEDEEGAKEATPARHRTLSPDPVSTNKLQSSSAETERHRVLLALAFDDTPEPLWKICSEFEISEAEYKRSKEFYELLLKRRKRLELWISYAQFEAFAMIQGSEIHDKSICIERGRAVFERGLSYFRTYAPELKEERAMLLEEWFDMENMFGDVDDVASVRAKLPQKVKKKIRIQTEDGSTRSEDYIDYHFP